MSRRAAGKGEDGKKKKQQAASLARRMAGKKGQTTQLQIEVNNDEDWERLITKEGVIVIDVYSDWSGPCVGMIGNLKKAKVEFGGESLHLAIAKNDEIEVLSRFRNRSEPTWLFAAGGQLVNGMFGANAPKLLKMIDSEVKREIRVLKGETWRQGVPFTELCDEEKERLRIAEKLKSEAEKQEELRKIRELEEKRMKIYNHMAENLLYETVVIIFPHLFSSEFQYAQELDSLFRSQMMYVHNQAKVVITREMFDEIFFRGALEPTDDLMEDLASGPCLVYLLKSQVVAPPGSDTEKSPGDLEKSFCEAFNMTHVERGQEYVYPDPMSIPAKYPYIKRYKVEDGEVEEDEEAEIIEEETTVPGCWTPATYITKCACVRYLFPVRAEKVMLVEPADTGKVVIGFDTSKFKECFDLMEEYPDDILDYGFFNNNIPGKAEQLCATPDQYAKLIHEDSHRLIIVVRKVKSEPLLSFAGMGATYVSHDEMIGKKEAALFFPIEPSERKFPKVEEAERLLATMKVEEEQAEEAAEEEEEQEQEDQDEQDLMALLGLPIE